MTRSASVAISALAVCPKHEILDHIDDVRRGCSDTASVERVEPHMTVRDQQLQQTIREERPAIA
jgi:outer membrane protein assembly factor BamE (lipoprotein component of BamABCDE complex)